MGDAPAGPVRVALVEDQQEIREGLRFLIDSTEGYRCTGSFGSMEEILGSIGSDAADVVLVDIGLPGMSGIEGIRRLKEKRLDRKRDGLSRTIPLTGSSSGGDEDMLEEMFDESPGPAGNGGIPRGE